jgi:hypothetical protein
VARGRWLSIKVELLSGGGLVLERHPGRVMIASPGHTLAEFAEAIDLAWVPLRVRVRSRRRLAPSL